MARRALYFPYIRVPETPWFTRVLLYWDVAGSIVPAGLDESEQPLGSYMNELIRAELVELVSPEIVGRVLGDLGRAFLTQLDANPEFIDNSRAQFERGVTTPLHSGKADYQLLGRLSELGVARQDNRNSPAFDSWWHLEERTATLYMALLASALSDTHLDADPVTDSIASLGLTPDLKGSERSESAADARGREAARDAREDDVRAEIIEIVLPAPAEAISVRSLVKFKERYGSTLPALRNRVEDEVMKISAEEDDTTRRRLMRALRRTLNDEIREAQERMRESQWRITPSGSTLAIATPVTAAASAVLAATAWAACPPAVLIPLAVWQMRQKTRPQDVGLPLVYAACAADKLPAGSASLWQRLLGR